MSDDPVRSAHDDLAFLRKVVDQGGRAGVTGGSVFFAGGLLYGVQCLYHWAQLKGWADFPPLVNLVMAAGPTVLFLAFLTVVLVRDSRVAQAGSQSRALQAMFSGVGLANLAMVAVFGINAARHPEFPVWLFYPAVIFALQGAAWFVVWRMRQRAWLGLVALGWLAAAVALGLSIDAIERYILIAAGALFVLMALPGAVMMRLARETA